MVGAQCALNLAVGAQPQSTAPIQTTRTPIKTLLKTPTAKDSFHFVIFGDRTGGVPAGLKVLRQAITDTNLIDPDLVMTVGDLIQGYNKSPEWIEQMSQYKSIMQTLNMNWYPVAGNHDIYWRGRGDAPEGHHESNYETHFGPLWYAFEHKKTGFIVLYSDEGNPKTNRKGFNNFGLQTMSDQQLAFLDQALKQLASSRQIFVFLHHPRWINRGGYANGNWDVVHKKLTDAGNVKAVFAGHIHQMRFDKPDDGIEYYTLGTTGGNLRADIPDAGYLHHINMVTVRSNRFSVSSIPVGAVFDPKQFTEKFIAQVNQARKIQPTQTSPELTISTDGACQGSIVIEVENPSHHTVQATLAFDAASGAGWGTTLDHQHLEIRSGQSQEIAFKVQRFSGTQEITSLPRVIFTPQLVTQDAVIRLPTQTLRLKIKPANLPDDFFANSIPRALTISGPESALEIPSSEIPLPQGPFTLEAWVKPTIDTGFNAIIAKTQSSGYSFFSDEGVPQFDVHLGGRYASASANEKLPLGKWSHLAGVFDGKQLILFIDGKPSGRVNATGQRRENDLSLFIGADPDRGNLPTRSFSGSIDEVRLSKTALYSDTFEPQRQLQANQDSVLMLKLDKRIGPFTFDRSGSNAIGRLGEKSKLIPVE